MDDHFTAILQTPLYARAFVNVVTHKPRSLAQRRTLARVRQDFGGLPVPYHMDPTRGAAVIDDPVFQAVIAARSI